VLLSRCQEKLLTVMFPSGRKLFSAYRAAREALEMALAGRKQWKGMPGELSMQFERALVSVVLNIAEGAGRATAADQRRHYAIARGSANEAGAVLGIVEAYRGVDERILCEIRSRLIRVVQMLNRMIG